MELRAYSDKNGISPFRKWFDNLDKNSASRVSAALIALQKGSFGKSKSVGGGVHELKIPYGPGYRVYFGNDGNSLVILLAGGTKRRQGRDIAESKSSWKQYKNYKGMKNAPYH